MAIISSNNKDIELTDLETHVALCAQRRLAVEVRLDNLEQKISKSDEKSDRIKNLFLAGLVSLTVGVAGTIFAVLFKHGVLQ
jgi:hypothetical protein